MPQNGTLPCPANDATQTLDENFFAQTSGSCGLDEARDAHTPLEESPGRLRSCRAGDRELRWRRRCSWYRGADCGRFADAHSDAYADADADADAHTHADADADADAHAHAHADSNPDADTHADADADSNSDADADSNSDADSNPDADTHAAAQPAFLGERAGNRTVDSGS